MPTPYPLVHPNARKDVAERKVFFLRKVRECEDVLRMIDSLAALFEDQPEMPSSRAPDPVEAADGDMPDGDPATPHRRKEDLYDEEMRRLLSQVTVASRQAVFQHFYRVFRGNTSVGAVESYLKRAALRGVIVRPKRGAYRLPPQTD